MVKVILQGNTYGIKDTLKDLGFKWNQKEKAWIKNFEDESKAEEIANRWYHEGVYGKVIRY